MTKRPADGPRQIAHWWLRVHRLDPESRLRRPLREHYCLHDLEQHIVSPCPYLNESDNGPYLSKLEGAEKTKRVRCLDWVVALL